MVRSVEVGINDGSSGDGNPWQEYQLQEPQDPRHETNGTNAGAHDDARPELTRGQLLRISCGMLGLMFGWATKTVLTTPIFRDIYGVDPADLGFVWLAGPLSGLVVQPVVGVISDHREGQGRRSVFFAAGTMIMAASLALLPAAGVVCRHLAGGGSSGGSSSSSSQQGNEAAAGTGLAVFALWSLDLAMNASLVAIRAVVADCASPQQQPEANTVIIINYGAGTLLGYGFGAVNAASWLGFPPGAFWKACVDFWVAALVLLAASAVATREAFRLERPQAPFQKRGLSSSNAVVDGGFLTTGGGENVGVFAGNCGHHAEEGMRERGHEDNELGNQMEAAAAAAGIAANDPKFSESDGFFQLSGGGDEGRTVSASLPQQPQRQQPKLRRRSVVGDFPYNGSVDDSFWEEGPTELEALSSPSPTSLQGFALPICYEAVESLLHPAPDWLHSLDLAWFIPKGKLLGMAVFYAVPAWLLPVCLLLFFSWVGWFAIFIFGSDWVGVDIFGGNPSASSGDESRQAYEDGVSWASMGLAAQAVVITGMGCGPVTCLVRSAGLRGAFLVAALSQAVCLLCAALLRPGPAGRTLSLVLLAALGVPLALAESLPYMMVGMFSPRDRHGQLLGKLNVWIVLAQLALTLCVHPIVKHSQDGDASVLLSGAVAAAISVVFVPAIGNGTMITLPLSCPSSPSKPYESVNESTSSPRRVLLERE